MVVALFSTDCPKCKVLKKKLELANVSFIEVNDVEKIVASGIQEVPSLRVDGVVYGFTAANNWLNKRKA